MANYGEIARQIILRNVGEPRFEEICRQFGLSQEDRELMSRLWSEWKPDYSLEDMVALGEKYKDYPNVGRVLQACELISREAARTSTLHRYGNTGRPA